MKKIIFLSLFSISVFSDNLIIEDFQDNNANWQPVSDQVMGGLSEIKFSKLTEDNINFYRLEGNVSTENNGGFIQFRAKINPDRNFTGVRIKTRGNKEIYEIHVRTPRQIFPWQYFAATFKAGEDWEVIEIPFSSFKSVSTRQSKFKSSKINWIGVVAYGRPFYAEVDLALIELY
ncbi:MAG: NADH:ubiquinone oxidoreductase [SAR86 cluster bacterium]|uniref:NADH:ubiquinone oxidoreductase n=1 Tax=SAR86 cluster bacterium TaxID=2030880 RepID=A0A520M477_9GAMM|nr:MAG: NADH:ubiquinone oxidoreductase [SAR86 cluster bacterium]